MQTFLPHPNFEQSIRCLDWRRLGNQRREALQIFNVVSGINPNSRWRNHPAVKMWMGYAGAIAHYMNLCIEEWIRRGYNNNMHIHPLDVYKMQYPPWLGTEVLHASHRSNLLRKDPVWYGQFGWTESDYLPYYWPTHNISENNNL
ncbi:MAG: hypothetical protein JSW11_00820 [Candidatus Heimdallarchaeota archaeon]|nr:MAG: hypothetical protein JSW11_00820 [Candidatus Heimdallarchaeota archaeon]